MNGRIKSIDGGRSRAENPRLRKIPLQDVTMAECSVHLRFRQVVGMTIFEQ